MTQEDAREESNRRKTKEKPPLEEQITHQKEERKTPREKTSKQQLKGARNLNCTDTVLQTIY